MIITWVQTAPPHAIPIHSQLLARKIPGNFRLAGSTWVHQPPRFE
jgi:hypothetical protein